MCVQLNCVQVCAVVRAKNAPSIFFQQYFFAADDAKRTLLFFQKIARFTKKYVILNKHEIAFNTYIYVDVLY